MKSKFCLIFCLSFVIFVSTVESQELGDTLVEIEQFLVHFDSDKSDLLPEDTILINQLLDNHRINNSHYFDIGSHTDDVGSNRYNIKLSKSRSESIVKYLKKKGVSIDNLSCSNYGETVPIVKGFSSDNRSKNRRSVIRLFKKNKIVFLKGEVRDEQNTLVKGAIVTLDSRLISTNTSTDENGLFEIATPFNQDYDISVIAKDYFFNTSNYKKNKSLERSKLKIIVPKIEIGKKFVMKSMHFWGNHCNILSSGLSDLERLRETMKINDEICIEISGHINYPNREKVDVGSINYNLSVARSLAIFDSLIIVNIDSRRILAKGYGNWKMVFPEAKNKTQYQKNRRVEIQILDCSIIENSNNDQIDNYESYDIKPLRIKFKRSKFIEHLDLFSKLNKNKILASLKHLKTQGLDPSQYTYGELLTLYTNM